MLAATCPAPQKALPIHQQLQLRVWIRERALRCVVQLESRRCGVGPRRESAAADKTLVNPEGMWHGLTRERGNEHVLERILEWTDARTVAAAQKLRVAQKRIR